MKIMSILAIVLLVACIVPVALFGNKKGLEDSEKHTPYDIPELEQEIDPAGIPQSEEELIQDLEQEARDLDKIS